MITLYAFGPMWGLPDPSPFVIKTETQLKMAGLAYRTELGAREKAPKGKLPFIDDDGEVICDSVHIRDHLQWKHSIDLDAGLSAAQRAQAWTIERMLEDHLYWAIVNARWGDDANFAKGPADFFKGAPPGVMEGARSQVIANLHGQGFGRHDPATVGDLARRSFAALSELLGDQPFLFGDAPTGTDASAYATLTAALATQFDSPVRTAAESFPKLVAYRNRMMAQFHPAFAPQPAMPNADSTRLTHA
ncbi:MAG: failed axon connections protein [Caulobacteraceae bacterium]|jgi:glutathione S-transferase|nr:failed axon connections protein [Caulobacteraceae bacterium]